MENAMVVRSVRLDKTLIDQIEKQNERDISEFIRTAIKEKLNKEDKEANDNFKIVRQLEKLDPATVAKKLIDLELLNQFLYEEMKKQNELLKLIHRRATLASTISACSLDNIKGEETRKGVEKYAINGVNEEILKLKI